MRRFAGADRPNETKAACSKSDAYSELPMTCHCPCTHKAKVSAASILAAATAAKLNAGVQTLKLDYGPWCPVGGA